MNNNLMKTLVNLTNTYTTLLADMYNVGADFVQLEDTNNVYIEPIHKDDTWSLSVGDDTHGATFSEEHPGLLARTDLYITNHKTLEILSLAMDEEETENFVNEAGTIPGRIKDISKEFNELSGDTKSIKIQFLLSQIVAAWFVALRWLEEAEAIGYDEQVLYVPSVTFNINGTPDDNIIIENNELTLSLNVDGSVKTKNNTISMVDYVGIMLDDDGYFTESYYAKQAVLKIEMLAVELWPLVH